MSSEEKKKEYKYHKSFTIDQEDELLTYFKEKGYVVIRDVLNEKECNVTLDEINKQMKELNPKFDINNSETYHDAPIMNNFGMYAKQPIFSQQFLENRQNAKIHKAFSILYGTDKFLISHDRCAFYRPTKDLKIGELILDKPEYKTAYKFPGLHLDFHPSSYLRSTELLKKRESIGYMTVDNFVTENNLYCKEDGLEIQAVLNLFDNLEEDGGFQCVPGFNNQFESWVADKNNFDDVYVEGVYHFSNMDKIDMKYVSEPIRVPLPKGAIIMWNQLMAHGTKPNNSSKPRCIQFMKTFLKNSVSKDRLIKRSLALKKIFKKNSFKPDKIGHQVFGK